RQNASCLAVLGDMNHLVQGTLEAARAGRVDGHGNHAGAYATKKRAKHFKSRGVGKQQAVARRETAVVQQVSGYGSNSVEERGVGVALKRIAIYIEKRIQKFIRVFSCQ